MPMERDVVILLDVTRSMRGCLDRNGKMYPGCFLEGPERNIWDDVVARVGEQIDQTPNGQSRARPSGPQELLDRVWPPLPAGANEGTPLTFRTLSIVSRNDVKNVLANLEPDAQNTGICRSLEYTLGKLAQRRASLGTALHSQSLYLYTDGADNLSCKDDFAAKLAGTYKANAGDYPYLHTVYVDLNQYVCPVGNTTLADSSGGAISCVPDIPASVKINTENVPLGNLAVQPNGANVTLTLGTPIPAGQRWTAQIEVLPDTLGLRAEPAEVMLGSQVSSASLQQSRFPLPTTPRRFVSYQRKAASFSLMTA